MSKDINPIEMLLSSIRPSDEFVAFPYPAQVKDALADYFAQDKFLPKNVDQTIANNDHESHVLALTIEDFKDKITFRDLLALRYILDLKSFSNADQHRLTTLYAAFNVIYEPFFYAALKSLLKEIHLSALPLLSKQKKVLIKQADESFESHIKENKRCKIQKLDSIINDLNTLSFAVSDTLRATNKGLSGKQQEWREHRASSEPGKAIYLYHVEGYKTQLQSIMTCAYAGTAKHTTKFKRFLNRVFGPLMRVVDLLSRPSSGMTGKFESSFFKTNTQQTVKQVADSFAPLDFIP